MIAILEEAGYGTEHVVRCSVWLDDPRDFVSFNKIFKEYFGANPPARACVVSSMVITARWKWIAWRIRRRNCRSGFAFQGEAALSLYCLASRALSGIGKLKFVRNGLISSPPRRI